MQQRTYFAPGRVNIIGEHLDYNGGLVMPCCIEQGITASVCDLDTSNIQFSTDGRSEVFSFDLANLPDFNPTYDWANYPLGVLHFLQQKGIPIPPLTIHFESTLPQGSGLSSSAAVEVLMGFIILSETAQKINRSDLAVWCQEVENKFIGVKCGIMDQFVIANGKEDHALLLNCNTLKFETIPFELDDYSLVIMNTKKPRSLIKSAYNERKQSCDESLAIIQKSRPISFLAEADMSDLELLQEPILKKRTRHVISEQLRVKQAAKYFDMGDLQTVGRLLSASHSSLQYDYEVSGIELDTLVETAIEQPGCLGGRMTGAGFGGCAIALVQTKNLSRFSDVVSEKYREIIGNDCEFLVTRATEGVRKTT